jgi:hypothetical protein
MRFFRLRRRLPLSLEDGNAFPDFRNVKGKSLCSPPERAKIKSSYQSLNEVEGFREEVPTFDRIVSQLIDDIDAAKEILDEKSTRALRKLFSMSEQPSETDQSYDPRTRMVRVANLRFVPALLKFLERGLSLEIRHRSKAAEYLALLLLNSISIPMDNKRLIALDNGGVEVLCKLLLNDPSCHMAAIILTNLTFSSSRLRADLVAAESKSKFYMILTLAYVLRVCSLTKAEYDDRHEHFSMTSRLKSNIVCDVQEKLSDLLAYDSSRNQGLSSIYMIPSPLEQMFPESVRWCLNVMQNLTRPTKESHLVANSLIRSGIVPHIFRFITVRSVWKGSAEDEIYPNNSHSSSSSETLIPSFPTELSPASQMTVLNPPSRWISQLAQDSALFIVMNIATVSSTIDYMIQETCTVDTMINIIQYYCKFENNKSNLKLTKDDDKRLARFQCLKARMTLGYLFGSYGNFGQRRKARIDESNHGIYTAQVNKTFLIMNDEAEALILIELVANTLHGHAKDGPGGYLSVMFHVKYVLFALRCLLTQFKNQNLIGESSACVKLNTLLLKVVALYSLQPKSNFIDADAAEYACFSLYLLSNYGFRVSL